MSIAPFIPDASEQLIGLLMAFGGGSLLFAVSVEMFAHALQELGEEHGQTLMAITVVCSVFGALLYIILNRILRCVSLRSPAPMRNFIPAPPSFKYHSDSAFARAPRLRTRPRAAGQTTASRPSPTGRRSRRTLRIRPTWTMWPSG